MIFKRPQWIQNKIGTLHAVSSKEIADSTLSIGFECLDRQLFDPEKCYDKLASSGLKYARCQTGWNRCEREKGHYDFTWLDDVVNNLVKRGIRPWFNVGFGNRLYMPEAPDAAVGWVPLYFGEECLNAWKNFLQKLAERYGNQVRDWEIWNEPNLECFWMPHGVDPLKYAKLVSVSGEVLRKAAPEIRVGACSASVLERYNSAFIKSGIGREIDFFSVHCYRIQPEKDYLREIASIRRLFSMNGGAHVEIWQGESGYGSHFPSGHFLGTYITDSELNQAKFLLRRFTCDLRAKMQRTSFFQIADMTARSYTQSNGKAVQPAHHGILEGSSYREKESYFAARNFASVFDSGTTLCDEVFCSLDLYPSLPKNAQVSRLTDVAAITTTFLRNGAPIYLYYLPEDVQRNDIGLNNINFWMLDDVEKNVRNPVLVDLLQGGIYRIGTHNSPGPQYCLEHLPLTDYPLLITDLETLRDRIFLTNEEK